MTLIDILCGLQYGEFNEGEILDTDDGTCAIEVLPDRRLCVTLPSGKVEIWRPTREPTQARIQLPAAPGG
jgi:hypothetical protein